MPVELIEEENNPTRVIVMGVGGGGCNAINRMVETSMPSLEFIAVNTDRQALQGSAASIKIQIGIEKTRGLGAGADPKVGSAAAEEQQKQIGKLLEKCDILFLTAGMGGGTGTGAAPVIAAIAKKKGVLCVAVVTKPFHFEMLDRMQKAETGIEQLRKSADAIIVIPNENLLKLNSRNLSVNEAFAEADLVLSNGVKALSGLILNSGFVNVDFADVRTVMQGRGTAMMSVSQIKNDMQADEIAHLVTHNNLLEQSNIHGAKAVLLNIEYGDRTLLNDIDKIIKSVTAQVDSDALCIHGFTASSELNDQLKITLIATGFEFNQTNPDDDFLSLSEELQKQETLETKDAFSFYKKNKFSPHSPSQDTTDNSFTSLEQLLKTNSHANRQPSLGQDQTTDNSSLARKPREARVDTKIYTLSSQIGEDSQGYPYPLRNQTTKATSPDVLSETAHSETEEAMSLEEELEIPTFLRQRLGQKNNNFNS